jgi:hypothetical protein
MDGIADAGKLLPPELCGRVGNGGGGNSHGISFTVFRGELCNLADDAVHELGLHEGPCLDIRGGLGVGQLLFGTTDESRDFCVARMPSLIMESVRNAEHETAQELNCLPSRHAGTDMTPGKGSEGAMVVFAGQHLAY